MMIIFNPLIFKEKSLFAKSEENHLQIKEKTQEHNS